MERRGGGRSSARRRRRFARCGASTTAPSQPRSCRPSRRTHPCVFGDRFVLKLIRKLDPGINPDLEIGRFLTERVGFPHTPPVAGALQYARGRGTLHPGHAPGFRAERGRRVVVHTGQPGELTSEHALAARRRNRAAPPGRIPLLDLAERPAAQLAHELIGRYLESARLLGERTAELHVALASEPDDPAFAPEPFIVPVPAVDVPVDAEPHLERVQAAAASVAARSPQAVQILDLEDEILGPVPAPSRQRRSTRSASASTATTTSGRCCTRARTS